MSKISNMEFMLTSRNSSSSKLIDSAEMIANTDSDSNSLQRSGHQMNLFESDQVLFRRPDLIWSRGEYKNGVRSIGGSGVLDVDLKAEIGDGGAIDV